MKEMIQNIYSLIRYASPRLFRRTPQIASILLLALFVACDMVNEDLKPCATYPNTITKVTFKYDFNMLREDLFRDHAGTAHLYVFDQDSVFLFDRSLSKNDVDWKGDFVMYFDTTQLKIGKKYLMVAMAQGNHSGYEWSKVVTPGFQVPLEYEMVPGVSKLSSYRIMLDRDSDSYADLGIVDYKDIYNDTHELMDTLWSTRPGYIQDVPIPYIELVPRVEPYPVDTIPVEIQMMRITNAIRVNLLHDSFDENTDLNKYNILIDFPNGNGTIDFTGHTLPNRELFYKSLRKYMDVYTPKRENAQYTDKGTKSRADETYAMHATFGVSRLQTTDGSSLQIRNGESNEILVKIGDVDGKSFSQWLADYFNSYYTDQDFLDREYDFTVDIHLNDQNVWDWYQIGCSILGWGKREYNYIPR